MPRNWMYPIYDENGDLRLQNDLVIPGNVVVTGSITAASTSDVSNNVAFPADLEVGDDLVVVGDAAAANVTATATVTGADGHFTDDLTVDDDAAVGGDLAVTGTFAVTSTTAFTGAVTATGGVKVPDGTGLLDANGNEAVVVTKEATATNFVNVTTAATGKPAKIEANGSDADVSLVLGAKGTNGVLLGRAPLSQKRTATVDSTAGVMTITAAQFLGGVILRDPNGAARSDILPTGTAIADALGGLVAAGDSVECVIVNNADAAETITITSPGASIVLKGRAGQQTITQNHTGTVYLVCSTATGGSEVFDAYVVGN
jgi:hypothetical protein